MKTFIKTFLAALLAYGALRLFLVSPVAAVAVLALAAVAWSRAGGDHQARSAGRPGLQGNVLAHLALTVVLTAVFAGVLFAGRGKGPNIGAGLALYPLLILGFPWSIPYDLNPYAFDRVSDRVLYLVVLGPAYLNVLLHGLLNKVRSRPRASKE